MQIENTPECYVRLWQRLETTRQLLVQQCRRFCIRNLLRKWFPPGTLPRYQGKELSFDDFVWQVCRIASPSGTLLGWTELPPPSLDPRPLRELIRALIRVSLGIASRQVNLRAIDRAYAQVFTRKRAIDLQKKGRGWAGTKQ